MRTLPSTWQAGCPPSSPHPSVWVPAPGSHARGWAGGPLLWGAQLRSWSSSPAGRKMAVIPRSPGVKPTARAPTGAGLHSPGGCWPAGTSQASPGLPGLWGSRGASPEPRGSPCSPRRPGGRAGPLLSKLCRRRRRPGPADRRGGRRDPSWEPVAAEEMELGPCSPTVTETGRAGV